jgi:ABC-type multidrug transport system fused ATPase/permease subunit
MKYIYLEFFKKNKLIFGPYLILLMAFSVEKLMIPHLYGKIVGAFKNKNQQLAIKIFMVLILVWALLQIAYTGLYYLDSIIVPRFQSFVRNAFLTKIMDSHSENFEELNLGNIITKISHLPGVLRDLFYSIKLFVFSNIVIAISSMIYLYFVHPTLMYSYIGPMVFMIYLCYKFLNQCLPISYKTEKEFDVLHEEIQDSLNNLLSIYVNRRKGYELKRLNKIEKRTAENIHEYMLCNTKYRFFFGAAFLFSFVLMNYISFNLFKSGQIKLETLVSTFMIILGLAKTFMHFFYDFKDFVNLLGDVQEVQDYVGNLDKLAPDYVRGRLNGGKFVIKLDNVFFRYTPTTNWILKGITLKFYHKEKIAIMGTIGSGKSTITKLLIKLYRPNKGKILLNGSDIYSLNTGFIRKNIMYIPQHPRLFNRTLWDNLSYGVKNITKEYVYAILRKMNMSHLERIFREKMDLLVGKYGSHLSGGQRQIVWLIRSFFAKSPIIILDEPTSSLDKESRHNVKLLIHELYKDRTLIVITHDNDLLEGMDRLITMKDGEVKSDKLL